MEHSSRVQYLKILQLEDVKDVTKQKIRQQYLNLALSYHPDKHHQNGISKEEAEEKFKELTRAYNYFEDNKYDSNNPYTWPILVADWMVDGRSHRKISIQLMQAMIKYYKKLGLFAKFLFRKNYHEYYQEIISILNVLNKYELQHYPLDFFDNYGLPIIFIQEDGYLQNFPDESQLENVVEITNGLEVDIYLPNINELVNVVNNKLDIMDKNNYITDIIDNKIYFVENIMTSEEKLKILKLYCIEVNEITELNRNKINNILKRLKF